MKRSLAKMMRTWADRLDHKGAPKSTGMSFYFQDRFGIVVDKEGRHGCRLWYLGDDEYKKAHAQPLSTP